MLLNDYQEQASGTAIYPGRMSPMGIMYAVLKMNGEAGELAMHLYKAKSCEGFRPRQVGMRPDRLQLVIKEVGDVMWYIAALADELKTTLAYVHGGNDVIILENALGTIDDEALYLNGVVGEIAEVVGKALRDEGFGMPITYSPGALREGDAGNGVLPSNELSFERRNKIIELMRVVIQTLLFICAEMDITLQLAMEINIKKLAARKAKGTLQGSGDNR